MKKFKNEEIHIDRTTISKIIENVKKFKNEEIHKIEEKIVKSGENVDFSILKGKNAYIELIFGALSRCSTYKTFPKVAPLKTRKIKPAKSDQSFLF